LNRKFRYSATKTKKISNAENYLLVTLYHGFHDFAKKAFSSCQNAKNLFTSSKL